MSLLSCYQKPLSGINVPLFMQYLQNYNQVKRRFLYLGLTNGFKLHYKGPVSSRFEPNHASVGKDPQLLRDKIASELQKGFTVGPFKSPPFSPFIVSPVGLVPKKEVGKYRMILDLSFPKDGTSVNAFIPREFCTVKYEDFDYICDMVVENGRGCLIANTDIESAFSILPISPFDYWLLGFSYDGYYYFKRKLPMGASISCSTFEELSRALQFILKSMNFKYVHHILDDFVTVSSGLSRDCGLALQRFIELCEELKIPLNHDKTVLPTTKTILHGIEVCTLSMTARLPEDKLLKAKTIIKDLRFKRKTTLKELQKALGFLNFACRVVKPGRIFLRRLFDLTSGVKSPFHHIRLTKASRKDLAAWDSFLDEFNGISLLTKEIWLSSSTMNLYSDAAQSCGFSLVFRDFWGFGQFSEMEQQLHISVLELYPIVIALKLWACYFENKCIRLHCDNMAVVHMINNQTSSNSCAMSLLRFMTVNCMKHNIFVKASHIPGSINFVADAMSRLQVDKARVYQPSLSIDPVPIGSQLQLSTLLLKY